MQFDDRVDLFALTFFFSFLLFFRSPFSGIFEIFFLAVLRLTDCTLSSFFFSFFLFRFFFFFFFVFATQRLIEEQGDEQFIARVVGESGELGGHGSGA